MYLPTRRNFKSITLGNTPGFCPLHSVFGNERPHIGGTATPAFGTALQSSAQGQRTARACTPTTDGWCPTSSFRRCSGVTSPSTATAQTRSFYYVDDLIDGLVRLMATRSDVTGPVNIGNPAEFSMLATMVVDLTGSRSRIVHRPRPQDDPGAAPA